LAGGGGCGDAFTRAPDLVWQDVLDEKVSRQSAARDYGVMIGEDGVLDRTATDRLRAGRKAGE
jgi:N-methylhydantoinase B